MANLNINGNLKITGGTINNKDILYAEEQGSNYIRLGNGLQICWGGINSVTKNNTSAGSITFPASFVNTSYEVVLAEYKNNDRGNDPANNGHSIKTKSKTGITISSYCWTNACRYIAIGKWK